MGSFPHDNFSSVYWIFNKLGHMIPLWKGKNPIYFGVKGQGHHYYKYNFWQQDRFCTITLVLYIGSLPNLATWFSCGRGRTLFILGSLPLYFLIIYIDRRILWCTHFFLQVHNFRFLLFPNFLLYLKKILIFPLLYISPPFISLRPILPKATPFIGPDFRCTEIVKYK